MSYAPGGMTLTGRGDPVQIPARIVSGNFSDVLGAPAALGGALTSRPSGSLRGSHRRFASGRARSGSVSRWVRVPVRWSGW
jgi:hypothetical protein